MKTERMPVHDFPCYSVDREGAVYRDGKDKPLSGYVNRKGYFMVNLSMPSKKATRTVHRVVLEAFVGLRPAGMHGCHKNGNKADNRLSNLVWATPTENEAHKAEHGTKAVGMKNGARRLTDDQVQTIRQMRTPGTKWGVKELAARFSVSYSTIVRAANGRHWNHLEQQ